MAHRVLSVMSINVEKIDTFESKLIQGGVKGGPKQGRRVGIV